MRIAIIILFFSFFKVGSGQDAQSIYDEAYRQLNEGVNAAEVIQTLGSCIKMDKSFEEAYLLRAFIFYKLDDYRAAIRDYDSLLVINPNHEEGLKKRALTKIRIEDFEGALQDHNLRLALAPNNASAFFDRAYCYGMLGNNDAAIEDYSMAIKINPYFTSAYTNRGVALLNLFLEENNNRPPTIIEAEYICEDFQKARKLGDHMASKYLQLYCTKY
ncbi:MAG: tetratricopeptide repeat protein [Chitinophagales bacterium]